MLIRKYSKFLVSVVLASVIALQSLPIIYALDSVSTSVGTKSGDYEYNVLDDGTAEITHYNGFSANVDIPDTIDGILVTKIAKYAFYWKDTIKTIRIPATINLIEQNAFQNCSNLKSFDVHSENQYYYTVDGVLFANNYQYFQLYKINTDSSGKSSSRRGRNGTALISYPIGKEDKTYIVPKEVQAICDYAFFECKLESIFFHEGLESIGEEAFAQSGQLKSVSFPSSLKSIGNTSFRTCSSLNTISLNDGINIIGFEAFAKCSQLGCVQIPVDCGVIAYDAFVISGWGFQPGESDDGIVLAEIVGYDNTVAQEFANQYGYPFKSLGELYEKERRFSQDYIYRILEDDTAEIIGYTGNNSDLFIPKTIDDHEISSIGYYAFSGNERIESIDMLCDINEINAYAFYGCSKVKNINIHGDDIHINGCNIFNCPSLEMITIFGYVSGIDELWDLFDIYDLSGVSLRYKPNYHYQLDDGMLTISTKEENINLRDFFGFWTWLDEQDIDIPIDKVNSIIIENGPKTIEDYSFQDMKNLKSISIPASVENIGWKFDSYESLCVFWGCDNLQSINLDSGNKEFCSVNGVLFDKSKSKLLKYPNGREGVFSVPDGVKEIGADAFRQCEKMASLSIPDSVEIIGHDALYNCDGLNQIDILNRTCEIEGSGLGFDFSKTGREYDKKLNNLSIRGYKESTAEKYANDYGFNFIALEEENVIGDIDGNGSLNVADRVYLTRYLAKWEGYETINAEAADVNQDNIVNTKDRIILARHLVNWKGYETLPVNNI